MNALNIAISHVLPLVMTKKSIKDSGFCKVFVGDKLSTFSESKDTRYSFIDGFYASSNEELVCTYIL